MRFVGYRWDEIAEGCDARHRLNVQWQRTFVETSLDGISVTSIPGTRELLVIEGEAEIVREIQKFAEALLEKSPVA
jgi:hypothetical protein